MCSESKSIKHGSWFQHTNLTFQEVMFLTYIVRREPAALNKNEHCFSSTTVSDWGQFCRETMLVFMQGCSVKGQWVFGGVDRESGKTFLVPVPDRTAETLMAVIDAWIEPGTTVISDCWGAYRDLDAQGYTPYTVNHSIGIVDQRTGVHTNTIESTWRHVKAYLSPYNRHVD